MAIQCGPLCADASKSSSSSSRIADKRNSLEWRNQTTVIDFYTVKVISCYSWQIKSVTDGQALTMSKMLPVTICHLMQNFPIVPRHRVFRVDTAVCPLISLRKLLKHPKFGFCSIGESMATETKVSNATMTVISTAFGAARRSAAGHKVLNLWGKVLHETVQAVVCPQHQLQANRMSQPPQVLTKFSREPEANCKHIRRRSSEANCQAQKTSKCTDLWIHCLVGLRPKATCPSWRRRSAAQWQKEQRGFFCTGVEEPDGVLTTFEGRGLVPANCSDTSKTKNIPKLPLSIIGNNGTIITYYRPSNNR